MRDWISRVLMLTASRLTLPICAPAAR